MRCLSPTCVVEIIGIYDSRGSGLGGGDEPLERPGPCQHWYRAGDKEEVVRFRLLKDLPESGLGCKRPRVDDAAPGKDIRDRLDGEDKDLFDDLG